MYTEAFVGKQQKDIFGVIEPSPRGWTELDRLQAQVRRLQVKWDGGELSGEQIDEFFALKQTLADRYREAEQKWKKCFGQSSSPRRSVRS